MRLLRHAFAILTLPTMVTVLIPLLLRFTVGLAGLDASPVGNALLIALGTLALLTGLTLIVWTVSLFDRVGDGTLAPWDAPKHLVLRGPYRHVRNPMISGVLFVLLAEALLGRSPVLLAWFVLFFLINEVYIPWSEEPGLHRRFGAEYAEYRRHVRRWVPRPRGWSGRETDDQSPLDPNSTR